MTVKVPVALLQYTGNESELRVEASTVGGLLRNLDARFSGLGAFIINESGQLRRYVNIFVNEEDIRSGDGLMTELKDGDRVFVVPVVAGG